jgi:hypothetical protein
MSERIEQTADPEYNVPVAVPAGRSSPAAIGQKRSPRASSPAATGFSSSTQAG